MGQDNRFASRFSAEELKRLPCHQLECLLGDEVANVGNPLEAAGYMPDGSSTRVRAGGLSRAGVNAGPSVGGTGFAEVPDSLHIRAYLCVFRRNMHTIANHESPANVLD